jgi:CII-binding regulator of phage lambda lysogenization HflD
MSFYITSILVLKRKLLSTSTYLQEVRSRTKTISEEKAILEKILENTPYTGVFDEFPERRS